MAILLQHDINRFCREALEESGAVKEIALPEHDSCTISRSDCMFVLGIRKVGLVFDLSLIKGFNVKRFVDLLSGCKLCKLIQSYEPLSAGSGIRKFMILVRVCTFCYSDRHHNSTA